MSDDFTIADPHFDEDRRVYTAPLPDEDMAAMFEDIAAITVDESPGPLRRLQQLPTTTRVALAVGASLSAIVVTLMGIPANLTEPDGQRMLAVLGGLVVLGIGSMVVSLRGLHRRTLDSHVWLFAGIALLIPAFISLMPGLWSGTSHTHAMPWESGCFWFGGVVAAITGVAVLLLQRSSRLATWRVLTAAAAGGCAGFITQQLFCPANDTWHILSAHGLLGLLVSALLLTALRIRAAV